MPQIILKERTAHLVATLFLQEMLIYIENVTINHQEQLFHRTLITGCFCPANFAKFLRTGFFIVHLQQQSFSDIPQNSYS